MTHPVMARCDCGWPILECSDCAPTPDDLLGLVVDEPPPPAVVTLTVGAFVVVAAAGICAWAAGIWVAVKLTRWMAGR